MPTRGGQVLWSLARRKARGASPSTPSGRGGPSSSRRSGGGVAGLAGGSRTTRGTPPAGDLLRDLRQGLDLSRWEPELCIQLLKIPAAQNYTAIRKLLQQAPRAWLLEFLERDGLGVLLDSLERLGQTRGSGSSMADISSQIECVSCTRAVINSGVGLQYMVRHPAHTRQLATILSSQNTTVKLQVFELLCAICMFSPSGHGLALDALQHFKSLQGHRYRFDAVIIELREADSPVYQTTLLAFINCLILANQDLVQRVRIRNEFIGLGLGQILAGLRCCDSDALHIQVDVFDKAAHADLDAIEEAGVAGNPLLMTHHQLFDLIFSKVANTPQALMLHSILLNLCQLDPSNSDSDRIWDALEELTAHVANGSVPIAGLGQRRESKSVSTQTTARHQRAGTTPVLTQALNEAKSNGGGVDAGVQSSEVKDATDTSTMGTLTPRAEDLRAPEDTSASVQQGIPPACPPPPPMPFASCPVPPPMPPSSCPIPPPMPPSSCPIPPPMPPSSCPIPPPMPHSSCPIPPTVHSSSCPILPPMPPSSCPIPPPMPPSSCPIPPPMPHSSCPVPPPMPSSSCPPPPPLPSSSCPAPPPVPVIEPPCVAQTHYLTYPSRRSLPPDMAGSLWNPMSGASKYNTFPHPRRKLKTLNWTKIPTQVIGGESVWTAVHSVEPRVQMDFNQIEELFCQRSAAPAATKAKGSSSPSAHSTSPTTPPVINLLDSKRSLAVNIFLKQFRFGAEGVVKAIKAGDASQLGAERLHGLQRLLPDKAELELIQSHPKSNGQLGTAEQFVLNLAGVPAYPLRIEAMLQKEQLPVSLQELKPQLEMVIDTCDQVIHNASLKEFLALVLQFGNFLNAGSYAGNAAGFRLNTLPKLLDMRANKPRITFLHYVVDVAESQNKDVLRFTTEMKQMRSAARISLEALEEEVNLITSKIKKLDNLLHSAEDDVRSQFSDFVNAAVTSTNALQILVTKAKDAAQRLALHFCEDTNGTNSSIGRFQLQECFKLFADFFDKVDQVRVENDQRRKQEEKAEKRRKAEEEKVLASKENTSSIPSKAVGRTRKPRGQSVLETEDPCLVDLLMQEIRGGTFKLRRKVPVGQA